MRLFGNMYAANSYFWLIACFTLGAALNHLSTYFLGGSRNSAPASCGPCLHYLIITFAGIHLHVLTSCMWVFRPRSTRFIQRHKDRGLLMDNVTQIAQLHELPVIAAGLVIGLGVRAPPSASVFWAASSSRVRSPTGTHQHASDQDVHRRGPVGRGADHRVAVASCCFTRSFPGRARSQVSSAAQAPERR